MNVPKKWLREYEKKQADLREQAKENLQVELLKATVTHSVLCVLFFSLWIDLDMLLDWLKLLTLLFGTSYITL